MKHLVLTGHIGQNPRFPLDKLARFIHRRHQHKGKAVKAIERDLYVVLQSGQQSGGFILLELDDQDKVRGVLAMLAGEEGAPLELTYLAAEKQDRLLIRQQLLRLALKISRGNVSVNCDLGPEDQQHLAELGYVFDATSALIQRKGGKAIGEFQ